ncbi:metalloendoproteinase 4-MMP-like [Impatiens glandulifera]|uniref:metalloendoproteinase 4-MMP-like n=1 Tax=Impatiens glandulifera TaxID=253017 RepID=UPI001FB14608|nr:metalloendoproteinase 4-MMP-like [Impatiens glandulifera]
MGTRSDAIIPITSAFQSWQNVTPFEFEKIDDYSIPDVRLSFSGGAYFRENPRDVSYSSLQTQGRIYFRDDIPWVIGAQPRKMDIETVALHEIGHILGLEDSNVPSAVMYPTASWGVTKRNLDDDDISGIKALYKFP